MRIRTLLLTTAALLPLTIAPAAANPLGGNVVGGQATISGQGTANVTVNQSSQNAIVNWHTFNIGTGERTQFVQPNSTSITLNRVTGGQGPSQILGTIDANGRVFLVNRDGIIFGAGAQINTSGFLATTHDIRNDDFMAGRYNFNLPGRPDASIVNMGTITASNGGFAALVAPGVRNSGTITANLGTVVLGAGNYLTLDMYGDNLIKVGVGGDIAGQVTDVATGQTLKSLVTNTGKLSANGGRVELTAAAARHVVDSVINTSGVIEANSVGVKNGQIVLSAATAGTKRGSDSGAGLPKQTVRVSGTLSASGKQAGTKGGKIVVTGENIEVVGATIDASGRDGGGTVMIGGDWGGGNPNKSLVNNQSAVLDGAVIANATTVSVDAATTINASAIDSGHGGKVILWADHTTSFAGTILALGGQQFGNGGFVETSGKSQLNFTGNVDTRAPNGQFGTLLLDPTDYYVVTTAGSAPTGASEITKATLESQLATGNVVITTSAASQPGQNGDIFVNAPIVWNASTTLTLSAIRDIRLAFISSPSFTPTISNTGAGNLILRADNGGSGTGRVILDGGTTNNRIDWSGSTGQVSIYYNPQGGYTSLDNYATGVGTGLIGSGGFVAVALPSQLTAYMLVNNEVDLQNINTNLAGKYALGKDIDATNFPSTTPLGNFTGILDGNGGLGINHTISNLTIAPTSGGIWNIGLFGTAAIGSEIRNLNFTNANVTANPNVPILPGPTPTGVQYVGVVVGQSAGTLTNVHVNSGSVNGTPGPWVVAGGLVGMVSGAINNSSSAASVSVGNSASTATINRAGGLAGRTDAGGDISSSTASGNVTGGTDTYVGGLAGEINNGSAVVNSSATGNVSVGTGGRAGGLVGVTWNGSSISGNSNAGGTVTALGGNTRIGGLVGWNMGSIANSFATGNVSAGAFNSIAAGGLVGQSDSTGTITSATASGNVTIGASTTSTQENNVGGLAGVNQGTITSSSATGAVTGGAHSNLGGLVGRNETSATITSSSASGIVDAGFAALQSTAGGLVGFNFGSIANSNASGQVTGGGGAPFLSTILGGLVGINDVLGTITTSFATGNVTGGASALAGGFAGTNNGTISGSNASGAVSSLDNIAGGFVGFANFSSDISNSFATGAVSGGGFSTGGFAGENQGTITNSYASGNVTDTSAGGSSIGGFAGMNVGTLTAVRASGAVTGGLGATAGGLVGMNIGTITAATAPTGSTACASGASCATGNVTAGEGSVLGGLAGVNGGTITNSFATGAVTADPSIAGGLVGANLGTITHSWSSGAVTGDSGSVLGGLVGMNALGTISESFSVSNVTGTGSVFAGGLAAFNQGTITTSFATGAVTGGDGSFVGGLVAYNIGITGFPGTGVISQAYATGATTGGAGSYVASLVAINAGSLDQTYGTGLVTAGPGSTTGGLVATNDFFGSLPNNQIIPTVFTPGTVTNSYWDTQTTGQSQSDGGTPQTTAQLTSGVPAGFDSNTWSSGGGTNYPFFNGQSDPLPTPGDPAPNPGGSPSPSPSPQDDPPQNIPQLSPLLNIASSLVNDLFTEKKQEEIIKTSTETSASGSGGNPGGASKGGGAGNAGRPPVNAVPPPGLGPLPSGMPPLNETRFASNEVVMQLGVNLTPEQVAALARQYGLEVIHSQAFSLLGRTVYRFRITGGLSVRDAIAALQSRGATISAQPSYTFLLGEAAPSRAPRQGDSAQYIVAKLGLVEAHGISTGKGVKVAVIDSEIDGQHPDLKGVIAGTFDALPSNDQTPHPHGTGMAGAIGSHQRLLGIAPNASILGVRAFGVSDAGAQGTSMNIVKGLEWAVQQGAQIINMSFAGPRDPILEQAIRSLKDRGIILIAASGNAGAKSPPLFPAADPSVIAVSATDQDDKTYKNAVRGKHVAIAAPGVDILVPAPEGGYQLTTGTSVAAAHISGVVALMLERNPRLTPNDIRNILAASAKKLPQGRNEIGAGLVDPLQALSKSGPKQAQAR